MVLEGANGALSLIAVMHVRGNKLEGGFPLESDGLLEPHWLCYLGSGDQQRDLWLLSKS